MLLGVKDRSFVGPPKTEMYYEKMQKLQCGFVFGTFILCVSVRGVPRSCSAAG